MLSPCRLFSVFVLLLATSSLAGPVRIWTERDSGRTLEAEYLQSTDRAVTIRPADGKVLVVPVDNLSAGDRDFLATQRLAAGASTSPSPRRKMRDRFEDVPRLSAEKIPVQGLADSRLETVDAAIRQMMAERGFVALSFAVAKNGAVLHNRAFGWGDAELKTALPTGLAMRLASVSKPLTAAGIYTLVDAGKLKLSDKVVAILGLHSRKMDPRWNDITIQHLLAHEGGWDREKSGDFAYESERVCRDLRINLAAMKPGDLVKWALDRPLDFDPGSRSQYSNFGYILLARVIEKLSGTSFVDALNATIGKSSGMTTLRLSRTDARDRAPGETWYCYHPEIAQPVEIMPVRHEAMDGSADLACSAADYCRFLSQYSISGRKRADARGQYSFFGSTHGCLSVGQQYPNGVSFTIISNRRIPSEGDGIYQPIIEMMDALSKTL